MTATVAVTGATGFVGAHLVRHLAGRGLVVRAVCRRPAAAPSSAADVVAADVRDATAVKAALVGAGFVIHTAGLVEGGRRAPADFWAVNLQGTRNVLAGAPPAARIVVLGTVSVYGPGDGGPPYTERSRVAPLSPYAASKFAAEVAAAEHRDAVVLRLAAVYGPGMRGNYLRLLQAVARRRFVMVGGGVNRRALVHVDDTCRAVVAAMEEAPAGARYNVTDGGVHTLRDIVGAMAAAAGVPAPRWRVPAGAARLAGRAVPPIAKLTEDLPVSGDLLRRETGYAPRVGLVDGWRSVLEWQRRAAIERG